MCVHVWVYIMCVHICFSSPSVLRYWICCHDVSWPPILSFHLASFSLIYSLHIFGILNYAYFISWLTELILTEAIKTGLHRIWPLPPCSVSSQVSPKSMQRTLCIGCWLPTVSQKLLSCLVSIHSPFLTGIFSDPSHLGSLRGSLSFFLPLIFYGT